MNLLVMVATANNVAKKSVRFKIFEEMQQYSIKTNLKHKCECIKPNKFL